MYSRINFDTTRLDTPWSADYFSLPGAADAVPPNLDQARKAGASAVVRLLCPALNPAEQSLLCDQIYSTVMHLPTQQLQISFEIHMALAHFRLPVAERTAREQRIAAMLDLHFANVPHPPLQGHLQKIKRLAVLVPDAAMDAVLRSRVIHTYRSLTNLSAGVAPSASTTAFLEKTCGAFGWDKKPELKTALYACFFSRHPDDQQTCLDLLRMARENRLHLLLPPLVTALELRETDLMAADLGDAVFCTVQAWVAQAEQNPDNGAMQDLVAVEVERFAARRSARCTQLIEATVAAIARGVAFDTTSKNGNAAALAAHARVQAQAEHTMSTARLRKVWAQVTPPGDAPPDTPPPDLDPVHAWSVDRLVRWIEGPITRRSASPRLDTSAIVVTEKQARHTAFERTAGPGASPANDEDLDEHDVLLTMRDALCSTARFFLDELRDLVNLGQRLKADATLLAPCQQLLEPLKSLILANAADEAHAQDVLQSAEAALDDLRLGIRLVQGSQLARQRFTRSLDDSLRCEPLVRGKRHGGVISAGLPMTDWGWAVQQFHRRWLPRCTQLEIDGVRVALPADQALGLYVTGSSRSQYAFDISVHLWRRRAGSTTCAGQTAEHLAPMRADDWFDTLIPCAVLHVPPRPN